MTTTALPTQHRSTTGAVLGWLRLIAATLGEMYLILLLALVAIAFLPTAFGWQATVVQTNSMQPRIAPGDVALTSPWSTQDPVPLGGVVSYLSPAEAEAGGVERIRLHRIVADNGDGTYTTAGDANAQADSVPLDPEQIIGQGRLLVEYIGLPSIWAKTGQYGALLFWAGFTVAALVAVFVARRDEDVDEDGHDQQFELAASRASDEPDEQPVAVPTRRAALGVLGSAAILTLALRSTPESYAAFSARASNAGNTWTYVGAPVPDLGAAANYRVLAADAVQNSPWLTFLTQIDGNVGVGTGGIVSGLLDRRLIVLPPNVSGSIDRAADNALRDASLLYANLQDQPATAAHLNPVPARLRPGTYAAKADLRIRSTLILDGGEDPHAQFIIRADNITIERGVRIELRGAARAENVWWVARRSITLRSGSEAYGTFVARNDITVGEESRDKTTTTVHGRLISIEGSASLAYARVTE